MVTDQTYSASYTHSHQKKNPKTISFLLAFTLKEFLFSILQLFK